MRIRKWLSASVAVGTLMVCTVASASAKSPIEWSLRSADGHPVTMRDLPSKWLLIYFGYVYCPDLCPTALYTISIVSQELREQAGQVQPIFISIDPERDTGEVLAQYVTNFEAPIIPLTGTEAEIVAATHQFDFHFVRYQDPGIADYSFDHSSSFFLLDPERNLVADFPTEVPSTEITQGIREHMNLRSGPKPGEASQIGRSQ